MIHRCYDVGAGGNPSPPQGLQLVLRAPPARDPSAEITGDGGGGAGMVLADTVVMNNLGYFQLQATPGVRLGRGVLRGTERPKTGPS